MLRLLLLLIICVFTVMPSIAQEQNYMKIVDSRDKMISVTNPDLYQMIGQSRESLSIIRNQIFARHGRPFSTRKWRDYFQNTDWYEADPYYTDDRIKPEEKKKVLLIISMESMANENKWFIRDLKKNVVFKGNSSEVYLDNKTNSIIVKGKYKIKDKIQEISNKVPLAKYGAKGWFFYDKKIYLVADCFFAGDGLYGDMSFKLLIIEIDSSRKVITDSYIYIR